SSRKSTTQRTFGAALLASDGGGKWVAYALCCSTDRKHPAPARPSRPNSIQFPIGLLTIVLKPLGCRRSQGIAYLFCPLLWFPPAFLTLDPHL
ncbi:hypothetical protein B0H16DRAFT_1893224, partial [Mycena metata]